MGLFSRQPSPEELAEKVRGTLVAMSMEMCKYLMTAWDRQLCEKTQFLLFWEIFVILTAVTDRLVFRKYDDPMRSKVMNEIINGVENSLSNHNESEFGATREDRRSYFERLFADRFRKYRTCTSIMGENQGSLVFTGALQLTEAFLRDTPESQLPEVVFVTGEYLGIAVTGLFATTNFKALCEK